MKPNAEYDSENGRLFILDDPAWGFYALCTATLQELNKIYPAERNIKVQWPQVNSWRDGDRSQANLFDDYFAPDYEANPAEFQKVSGIRQLGIYEDIDYDKARPYLKHYFRPSERVEHRIAHFLGKYGIDPDNTIGLCIRGTDKWIETGIVSPAYYLQEAKRLLGSDSKLRLLVQTDQKQLRDYFMYDDFQNRAFFLEELPATEGTVVMHKVSESEKKQSNFELGINMLAAVNVISRCKYVLTHTGNVGLWISLFRGHARNTCQFMVGPPDIISSIRTNEVWTQRMVKRLRRFLRRKLMR